MLISLREVATFAETWEPSSVDKRVVAIAGAVFSITGVCLMLMLAGTVALFGNDFLWPPPTIQESTKIDVAIAACVCICFGILGFMRLMYDAIAIQFENIQNSRHALLVAVEEEEDWGEDGHQVLEGNAAASGVGISGMFAANFSTSSSDWVQQIIGRDHLVPQAQVGEWCRKIDDHPYATHIKYFAALLKRDVSLVAELSGMPICIIHRLQEALSNEHESPWRTRSLDFTTWHAVLARNNVLLPIHPMEVIFGEIDHDGSGTIMLPDFLNWMSKYRPVSQHQKRTLVLNKMFRSIGFWNLVCPLVGSIVVIIPLWGGDDAPFSVSVGVQVVRTLAFTGAVENLRQAWRGQAVMVDAYEQAKLELKASVETECDRLERQAIQARKQSAISEVRRKMRVVAAVAASSAL